MNAIELFKGFQIAIPFIILGAVTQRNVDVGWNEPFISIAMVCFALIYYYSMNKRLKYEMNRGR